MLNISRKNIWYLVQNNLHISVHHWAFPSDICNHLLNSELDVKTSSFPATAGLLFYDKWKYVVIAGALFQCLAFWHPPVFMGVRRGEKMGICHHLEIGTKNQKFLENLKSAA